MRALSRDHQTVDRGGEFFTVQKVGRTRELTPEGYLLCRDVRIARTGEMLYREGEVPLEAGRDKIIRVERTAEELFRPESIASYNGKAVTIDHPDEDVNPENWRELAVGIVLNARRGEGADSEHLMADLLITEARGIAALGGEDGNEDWEVSCGYDADYEQTAPGRGLQVNFIGNHVALVENGRCGPTCSIGDSDMTTRDLRRRRTWKDRIMTAFRARDEAALTEELEKVQDEMTNGVEGESGPDAAGSEHRLVIEVKGPNSATQEQERQGAGDGETEGEERRTEDEAPAWFTSARAEDKAWRDSMEERLSKLEGATSDAEGEGEEGEGEGRTDDEDLEEEETRDGEGEAEGEGEGPTKDRARTGDSAGFAAAFQDMIARAEILSPGIKLPTFDAKASGKVTRDRMCAFKRRALVAALEDDENASLLEPLLGKGRDLSKLTCDSVGVNFVAASELVKKANSTISSVGFVHDGDRRSGEPLSIADMNQRNRDFWRGKGGAL